MKSVVVAMTATVAFLPLLSGSTAESVLGRWSNGQDSLAFRRDGTVIERPLGQPGNPGEAVTLKFRVEGDQILITTRGGEQLIYQLQDDVLFGPGGDRFQRWDQVTVIFGFTTASDGSRRHIKVVRYEDPFDRQELKRVLTEKEKQAGLAIMAKRKDPPPKKGVSKKRYDFLLFDNHTRTYLPQ